MSLADTFQHSGIPVSASCLPVWTCWLCSPSSASISNVYMLCFSGPYILWWGRPPKWLCSQVMPLMPSLQGPSFLPWFYSCSPRKASGPYTEPRFPETRLLSLQNGRVFMQNGLWGSCCALSSGRHPDPLAGPEYALKLCSSKSGPWTGNMSIPGSR